MESDRTQLEAFFAAYAARFNEGLDGDPDVEGTAGSFTDYFMEANPNGVLCGKNDDTFRAMIPQGYAFYRKIGTKSMRISSLDLSRLDAYHWMATVQWESLYEKKDDTTDWIDFTVIYFLQTIGGTPRIFAYIAGDEQKALREKGLLDE
jgi:hypothetical protein